MLTLLLAALWFAFWKPMSKSEAGIEPTTLPTTQSTTNFFLAASGDVPEQGFATLSEAVDAAKNGSVIECRFNGIQSESAIRRNEKALVIRAGDGFEPVLAAARDGVPILFTHAPLVLEGLTIKTRVRPKRTDDSRWLFGSGGVSIEDGSFWAAYCRFEIEHGDDRPQPHAIRLLNVAVARFLNCEIISGGAFGLEWNWRREDQDAKGIGELQIVGSLVEGNLLTADLRRVEAARLILHQSTFGGSALLWPRAVTESPLELQASGNVFVAETLVNPIMAARDATLQELLRWVGTSNIYCMDSYARTAPPLDHHDEWLGSDTVQETNSLATELGLDERLANLTEHSRAAITTAFALTAEERQRLVDQGWPTRAMPGADPQKTGPGQPYHEWRNSPDYAEWAKRIREHISQSLAEN